MSMGAPAIVQRSGRVRRALTVGLALPVAIALTAHAAPRADDDDDELVVLGTPTVAITAPADNTVLTAPGAINFTATARAPAASIRRIDYFQGASALGSATLPPYALTYPNLPAGIYTFTARALSSFGITASSTPVTVRVCGQPSVSVVAPAAGAVLAVNSVTTIQASAASPANACALSRVDFYYQIGANPAVLIGTINGGGPYQVNWTPAAGGAYSLTAKVTDERGVAVTSSAVPVTLDVLPTVTLTAPAAGSIFTPGSTVTLTATASDADGSIARVEFYNGAALLGSATTSPYTFNWPSVPKGNYTLTARAYDNLGLSKVSTGVPIVVTQRPTVSITAPANNTVVNAPATVTLSASASDPDGTIAKVEFYSAGSTLICTATTAPYSCTWSNVASGSYTLTAKAYDDQGATTTSAAVTLIVNVAPTVTLTAPANGATYAPPATIALAATASDSDGTISKVEFYNGATLIATDTVAPYTAAWSNVGVGVYSLTAKAYDNRNVSTTSAAVSIRVCGPPSVSLTSPAANQQFATPATITLSATASAATGCAVQKVEFYNGSTLLNTDTASPYSFAWSNVVPGTYTLKARVYDNVNQFVDSATVTVQVISDQAPIISSITPTQLQIVYGSTANYTVVASDPDAGDTVTVQMLRAGSVVATGVPAGPPNTYALTYTPGGAVTNDNLVVRVTDSHGIAAQQTVLLTVISPPASAAPNPDVVIPGTYSTPGIGTIAGTFGVSDSGAATYSIPIQVPPGPAGFQPDLALTYSSQGGNGLLGVGWSLGGLSVITRCPKSVAQDGIRTGVNYDLNLGNDVYCLDGQRLVAVAGPVQVTDNAFQTGSVLALRYEYRTELDTYARIQSYQEASPLALNGPYRFRVWSRDGRVTDYGSRYWIVTAGQTQRTPTNESGEDRQNAARLWVADRIVDRSGNFMEIDYADRMIESGQSSLNVVRVQPNCTGSLLNNTATATPIGSYPNVEYWPAAIRYYSQDAAPTGCPGGGTSPKGQVKFIVQDVPSQAATATRDRYYDSGAGQVSLSKRLSRIEVSVDDTGSNPVVVRNYNLSYLAGDSLQTHRTLLSAIQLCAGDGACLPPTQLEWAQKDWTATGHAFTPGTVALPFKVNELNHGNTGLYVGDWNGDGKSDVLGWVNTPTANQGEYRHDLILCLSTGSGFTCGSGPIAPFGTYTDNDPYGGDGRSVELMDINNDGLVDLAYDAGNGNWQFCISNGGFTCTLVTGWTTSRPNAVSLRGDFDGDGKIDVLNYLGNNVYEVALAQGSGFSLYRQNVGNVATTVNGQSYPAYPYSACGRYSTDNANCEDVEGSNVQYQVLVADVNGDGKADLIRRRTDDSAGANAAWKDKWKVCFSHFGTGDTNQFECHDRFVQGGSGTVTSTVLFDFNGDGIADMASTESTVPSLSGPWRVCLSTGSGAFEFRDPNIHWDATLNGYVDGSGRLISYYNDTTTPRCRIWTGTGAASNEKVIFGDFNGDGRTDIASWNPPSWRVCLSTGSDFSCSDWSGPNLVGASNPDLNQWVITGDFNGDGKTDVLCLHPLCTAGQLGLSAGPQSGDVLTKITTGLQATTQITYAALTDTSVYSKAGPSAPGAGELDIQSPMTLVKSTQASNGVGGFFTQTYFYENLRGRIDGRPMYGFAKKRMRDGNGVVTETEYNRVSAASYGANWPAVGQPSIVRKYAPASATYVADITNVAAFNGGSSLFGGNLKLVNRATNTWSVRSSSSCGFVACPGSPTVKELHLTTSLSESFELDGSALPWQRTTTPLLNIDAYGNAGQVTVDTSDGYSKATTNTFANEVTNYWLLGRLTLSTVSMTKPGIAPVSRKSQFTYHGVNGNCAPESTNPQAFGYLCDEEIEPDFVNDPATSYSLWQKTSYTYDKYGNRKTRVDQFKKRDGTLLSRTTSTGYSYQGRYATSLTDAANHTETRDFDTRFGTMKRQQDANGVSSTSLFDGFGRKYGERFYDVNGVRIGEAFTPVEASGLQGGERYRARKLVSGGGETQTYFDELQREVRVSTRAFAANTYAQATTIYDALGRRQQIQKPAGSGTLTTSWQYDVLNRPQTETSSGTSMSLTTQFGYSTFASLIVDGQAVSGGSVVTATQSGTGITTRSKVKYTNSQGQTVRVTDGEAGNTDFGYDAYGNLAKTIGPNGIAEVIGYDRRGRKTSLASPDSGTWTYQYNGIGELITQIDPKGQYTVTDYDNISRAIERREHPGSTGTTPFVTVWSYDAYADGSACANGRNKLCEVRTATTVRSGPPGALLANPETRTTNQFDAAERANASSVVVDGRLFESYTTFDANGRIDKLVYPSGYIVQHRYTAWSGQLDRLTDATSGAVHWLASSRFADGQIDTMSVGGQSTSKTYDGFGRVATVRTAAGVIQNASYGFDALGNLASRGDPAVGQGSQMFAYDRVDRLTSDGITTVSYWADGNIQNKGGAYTYYPGTHRLNTAAGYTYNYDGNGNVFQITGGAGTRTLAYAPFNLPTTISGPAGTLTYVYDGSHARLKELSQTAAGTALTYYLGGFEQHIRADGVLEERHYLNTPEGTVGVYTIRSNAVNDARYWHKDHLGSIVAITDSAGAVKQSFTFDAWGNRTTRVLATGEPYAEERAFTGHEQLVEVGLTHMNGRLYDPVTGRFLQSDPLVQDPFNGQSYNRFGYVLNNPLSYTDPTGFSFWTKWRKPIMAMAAAVLVSVAMPELLIAYADAIGEETVFTFASETGTVLSPAGSGFTAASSGFAAGGVQGGNIESAVAGAVFAAANFGIGELTGHTPMFGTSAFYNNVGLHAVVGCAQQAAAGGTCRGGALAGGFSAFAGPLLPASGASQFIGRLAVGGLASRLGGDKFENGVLTAAFDYLFNAGGSMLEKQLEGNRVMDIRAGAMGMQAAAGELTLVTPAGEIRVDRLYVGTSGEFQGTWSCGESKCGPYSDWEKSQRERFKYVQEGNFTIKNTPTARALAAQYGLDLTQPRGGIPLERWTGVWVSSTGGSTTEYTKRGADMNRDSGNRLMNWLIRNGSGGGARSVE